MIDDDRRVLWVLCARCFAASIWPDLDRLVTDEAECRNCGAMGSLCGCDGCQEIIFLLDSGRDVRYEHLSGTVYRIHAAEWTRFFGAKKMTEIRE